MAIEESKVEAIFFAALEKQSPEDRVAYLDEACASDASLRLRVEALLNAQPKLANFLQGHAAEMVAMTLVPPPAERPGAQIGPYKLLQQIGEGGMGTVFMAEQTQPVQRKVALKLIKPGMDSGQIIARFEAERQALAMMDHVNIARVLDAGATESGRPYFVMELINGVPITKYCDDNHLTPRERLELFVPVCQAIQHAHQKGIIHRDIKPSNVMVTLYDGKPIPKVIDFGVAKATEQKLTERTLFTQFGTMVGTLEYMSPEQAEMSALGVDTRSDIYSLGVLLYELLTGSTPLSKKRMKEAAYAEILRLIKEEEPPKPSTRLSESGESLASISAQRHMEPAKLTKLVRGELDWIVMKTLEKDRNRRYETANGFAADVQRYLADEPVQACPPSAGYRVRKFARRNRGPVFAASLVLVVLVAGMIGTTWGMFRATHAEADAVREAGEKTVALVEKETALATAKANELEAHKQETLAKENAKTAKEQELLARRRQYASQINLAQQAWEIGHSARVLELLEGQRPKFDQEDLRSFEWYYLWQQCHKHQRLSWRARRDDMFSVALSPDGTMVASASHGRDGTVKLWSTTNGQQRLALRGHQTGVWRVAFSPDGKILASGSVDGTVKLWDPATGQELATIVCNQMPYGVRDVAFSPDGKTLATSNSDNNTVKLWDVTTKKQCGVLKGHTGETIHVAFSADGKMLATSSGSGDGSVKLWSWDGTAAQERLTIRETSGSWGLPVRFSPDSKTLAIGMGGTVDLYDVATGNKRASLHGHRGGISSLAFSPDGKTLASGSGDRTVRVWDLASGQERNQFPYLSPTHSVSFSDDGKLLAAGSDDGMVKVWEPGSAEAPDTLKHGGAVKSVVFSRDGQTLIAGGDHPTKLWDVAAGKEKGTLPGPIWSAPMSQDGKTREDSTVPGMWSGAISQDGSTLCAPGADKTITVWNLTTGQAKAKFTEEKAAAGALSPDGTTLATFRAYSGRAVSASASKTVELWNTATGQLRTSFQVHDLSVMSVAFSPDGKTLATGGQIYEVSLWDTATGKEKLTFDQGESGFSAVLSLRFSPDGKTLATGSGHGTVRLRNVADGQLIASLKGHTHWVGSIAFSPDGKTVACASDAVASDAVKFWDAATGQERLTLKAGAVTCVAFAPDGKTLATASADGTAKLWRAATDHEATAVRTELDPDDPESPVAVNALGDRLRETHRPREAEDAYRKALARLEKLAAALPDTPDYRHELAYCLLAPSLITDPSTAAVQSERQFAEIWRTLPADERFQLGQRLLECGKQLRGAGHFQEALRAFSKAIELSPDHADAYHERAHAYEDLKEWDRASADFAEAIQLSPIRTQHYVCRARSFELSGHPENAARDYTQLIELKADSPLVWYKLALFELQRGDHTGYRKLCSGMLERFDQSASVDDAFWVAWTCALAPDALSDWTKPLEFAEKAHADDGKNYDKINYLGAVLYRAGRFQEATQRLTEAESAFKQTPSTPSTIVYNWLFQAMAQHRLGHETEAASWLKKAVQDIDEPKKAEDPATIPWNRRLTLQLLRSEAEELLKQESGVREQESEKKPD